MLKDYKTIAAEKQLQRQAKIPKEWLIPVEKYRNETNLLSIPATCGVLSEVELEITRDYDATDLLAKLKAGEYSAEQVTVAFCKRAAIAQQLTNCLTEIFFDEAIARAQDLDRERQSGGGGSSLRPLHGLPVSLKDSFQVEGHDTSTGLACFVNEPAEEHSSAAAMLLDLGAVLYCKTNLPQTIMTGDSDNNVFGRTLNPNNTSLTAGGSTGGEGALIALRGSIIGVGTDVGGSIRVPSLADGIYGFRPSVGMIPHGGVRNVANPGTDGVRSSAGPMATSVRDCALFLETFMQAETWRYDSTVISVGWRGLPRKEKLRIGVVEDDGMYTPTPPMRRGLKKAVDSLRQSGIVDVVPIVLPDLQAHIMDLMQYYMLLGGKNYLSLFAQTGEPIIPSLQAIGLLDMPGTTLAGFFELNVRRAAAAKQYLSLFRDNALDAILMPPAAHTAVPLDTWSKLTYTGLWNYLDYPAVVIPVDKVCASDHADDISNAKYGAEDEKLYRLYTGPDLYRDAPIAVQLVGYRYMDEDLMNTAITLDGIFNARKK